MVAMLAVPSLADAAGSQVCTGRSIRFVSGQTASSDTLRFGVTLPAGVYDAMLVTADSYPERASTDPTGQQSEIVEVAGIVSHDLTDGVESTNDITYATFTASAPFSSVIANHRGWTPGPNSVWVSTFCLTPSAAPATTTPTTAAPTTAAPTTAAPTTAAPTTAAPTTAVPPTTATPSTAVPPTTATPTTPAPTTPAPTTVSTSGTPTTVPTTTASPTTASPTIPVSTTTTSDGSILGPSTSVPSTTAEVPAEPFGFGEPIPAGPIVTDVMHPSEATTPASGTLPLTGMGLGVVVIGLALVASGGVTAAGAKADATS